MGYNIVKYREECVILQIHFHPDVFMDLFSDSLRDNQLYFLLDLTLGQKNFIQGRCLHTSGSTRRSSSCRMKTQSTL